MNDTHAVTVIPVSGTCEHHTCERASEVTMVVTGQYGEDGIAAYCEDHAADRDDTDAHTAIGEVDRRE